LSNDTDPDLDSLTLTSLSDPSHGTASIVENQVLYTPETGYQGADSFTYTVSDGNSHQATATISITVLSNPIYYLLSFETDKSAVPSLYYQGLSYRIHLGAAGGATVSANGTTIASTYDLTTGDLTFTSQNNASAFEILIKNPADVSEITIQKAALKDNKKFAWSHGMDDNVYLANQVALFTAKGWHGGLYLISNIIQDNRQESWIFDKPSLTTLLNSGWALGNHTWDHQCFGEDLNSADFMQNTILNGYNKLMEIVSASTVPDFKILGFAAPCFATQYDAYITAMRADGSTAVKFNESQGNGLMQIDSGATGFNSDGKTAAAVSSTTEKIGRDLGIESDYSASIAILDWMADNATTSRYFWYNTLSHGNKEGALGPVIDHAYENYGPAGTDEAWVTSSTEIYSYLLVRDNTEIVTSSNTQVADGSAPTVSNLQTTATATSASFAWDTSRDTSGQVVYGLTSTSLPYNSTLNETLEDEHTIELANLPRKTLFFRRWS